MLYYDINNQANTVKLYDAVVNCVPPSGGMYLPETFPSIPQAFLNNMDAMSLREIAYVTSNIFLSPAIDSATVKQIVDRAFAFEIPFVRLGGERFALEMFHGPTMAFKDIGAIFMAEMLRHFGSEKSLPVKVVVASTGNTASAVANAFAAIEGLDVYVLVPRASIGDLAMPAWSPEMRNIHLIEVAGNIDECKGMVAAAFADKTLRESCILTTSNSINISRIISQVALFYYAASRLKTQGVSPDDVPFSLPSGNLSMLTAGIIAKATGLKCGKLIAACNANNVFDIYMKSGHIPHKSVVRTTARYMDTAMPLNLPRIQALFHSDMDNLRKELASATVGDSLIADTIVKSYNQSGYVMDPHTAVAVAALDITVGHESPCVAFATASPLRSEHYLNSLSIAVDEPNKTRRCFDSKTWCCSKVASTYPALRKKLLEK